MILTVFLSIVVCGAVSLMLVSAVAFIQDTRMFSSAPKEARDVLIPRDKEVFFGARAIGWVLMAFSILMILGAWVSPFGMASEADSRSGSSSCGSQSCLPYTRCMT